MPNPKKKTKKKDTNPYTDLVQGAINSASLGGQIISKDAEIRGYQQDAAKWENKLKKDPAFLEYQPRLRQTYEVNAQTARTKAALRNTEMIKLREQYNEEQNKLRRKNSKLK